MNKILLTSLVAVIVGLLVFSGCTSGVPQADYDAVTANLKTAQGQSDTLTAELETVKSGLETTRGELETVEGELDTAKGKLGDLVASITQSAQLVAQLSAISAYSVWYDQYYGIGMYVDDVAAFNIRLGSLVAAAGDANTQAAFNVYYEADQAYNAVVAGLPTDNSAWSLTQYNSWVDTGKVRADALGQVGGYLNKIVDQVEWFQIP